MSIVDSSFFQIIVSGLLSTFLFIVLIMELMSASEQEKKEKMKNA